MRALYALVCRLRTLYALTQGTITLALDGPTALPPAQWLLLGCGLGLALRVVVPSPPSAGGTLRPSVDRLLSFLAAVSVVGLAAIGMAGPCLLVGKLILSL